MSSSACCRTRTLAPAQLGKAMRYAVLGGGKRVRPLLAYAAGEVADARSRRRRCGRRRGRADPRVFADSRRPSVHGRRHAAPRQADVPCRVRRSDRAARRRRAAGAGVRRARRRAALRSRRLRAARRGVGHPRHGGWPGDRPRQRRRHAGRSGTRNHAPDEDRRVDPRRRASGRGVRTSARRRRASRARRFRPGRGPRVPGRRRRARRRRLGGVARQDRRQGRRARQADVRVAVLDSRRRRRARRGCACEARAALAPFGVNGRRLAELADWIVLRAH